jgi:hypothetical protein
MDITSILGACIDHALTTGLFSSVSGHEPKGKNQTLGPELTAAMWVQDIAPVPKASGLNATSGRLELTLRIYTSMLAEPQDSIDPNVLGAVDIMMTAYSADFELGGNVKHIDLLGEHGRALSAKAGYLNQGGRLFRVMDVCLPLILNDLWAQNA